MISPLITYLLRLKTIPGEDQSLIMSHFETKTFKEDDYLFRGGRVCDETFFICNGVVRIASINEKGVTVIHYFYKENHFCTILQSFNEASPTDTNIEACCSVEAMVITKSRLLALYQRLPYMKELMDGINQQQLLEKVNMRNTYLGEDAENRYKLFIAQQPGIALRVPVKDIASFLGITPQSLSRIRKNIR